MSTETGCCLGWREALTDWGGYQKEFMYPEEGVDYLLIQYRMDVFFWMMKRG